MSGQNWQAALRTMTAASTGAQNFNHGSLRYSLMTVTVVRHAVVAESPGERVLNAFDEVSRSTESVGTSLRLCIFCCEEIRPGASVCPHCGGSLVPLQTIADRQAAMERRLAALEEALAARPADEGAKSIAPVATHDDPGPAEIRWPHMADNIFLGLTVLVAAHWLATTLPAGGHTWFRLVALVVALPFGFRFEQHSRTGTSGQVIAALAFGSIGTLAIGVLDLILAGHGGPLPTPEDVISSVATIALSHFAGSAWAQFRQPRRKATLGAGPANPLIHIQTAQIKSTADAIKALYDAAAPIAAGAAALWAAFGHAFF
jgi:hypothetical protein